MKKFAFLLIFAFMVVGTAVANNDKPGKPTEQLTELVDELLEGYNLPIDAKARVVFALRQNNEIIVVNIQTEQDEVEAFIKSRLNNQEADEISGLKNAFYTVHVSFEGK